MMIIPVPALPAMSPTAVGVLMERIAHFAFLAQIGEDYPITLTPADRKDARPVIIISQETAAHRAVQVALAAGYVKRRDEPQEVLLLSDSFMSRYEADDPAAQERAAIVPPREDPRAVECLVLHYANPGGTWFLALPYGRDDDGRILWERPDDRGWIDSAEMDSGQMRALRVAIDGPAVSAKLAASLEDRDQQRLHGVIPLGVIDLRDE